jgi:hypothetical protein
MSILNLNAPQGRAPRNQKTTRIWLGVGLLVAVLGIGSTFAANITLNNNQNTEFGQGVQTTTYCGGSAVTLTVTPFSGYKNTGNAFYTTGFRVTGIPVSCNDTDFNINFYDTSSNTAQNMVTGIYSPYSPLVTATVAWFDTSTALTYQSSLGSALVFPKAQGGNAYSDHIDTATATGSNVANTSVTAIGAFLSSTNSAPPISTYLSAVISNVTSDAGSGLGGAFSVYLNTSSGNFYNLVSSINLGKVVVTTQNEVFATAASLKPCSFVGPAGSLAKWSCSATFGLTPPTASANSISFSGYSYGW